MRSFKTVDDTPVLVLKLKFEKNCSFQCVTKKKKALQYLKKIFLVFEGVDKIVELQAIKYQATHSGSFFVVPIK